MQIITEKETIAHDYEHYLRDESRLQASGLTAVYLPESIDDVCRIVKDVSSRGERVCISGGRTGIVGGAVPLEIPNLISADKLQAPCEIGYDATKKKWFVRVCAGERLCDLNEYLQAKRYTYLEGCSTIYDGETPLRFPVNPTEATAQIGGIVASNASGSHSFLYGPVRDWIRRIRVVLSDGSPLELLRGQIHASGGSYRITPELIVPAFDIDRPRTKQTLAYAVSSSGDAIDLFIGSEGTLGFVTDVDLYVCPAPPYVLGQMIFFRCPKTAIQFIAALKSKSRLRTVAIEYYDQRAISMLSESEEYHACVPADGTSCALYVENIFSNEKEMDDAYDLFEAVFDAVGISIDASWAADDEKSLEKMSALRHYIPETINRLISDRKKKCPDICKVSSDMAVPAHAVEHMLEYYEKQLHQAGLEYVMFGHIGDGHVHVNIIPSTDDELTMARKIYEVFARETVRCGGAIAAEHGIGRLKKSLLPVQFSTDTIEKLHEIKKILDPRCLFNPGVIF